MDRQPQHPFARNTSSPYGRPPFQQSSNQAPFPPSSHPPNGPHTYPEPQRRPSEPGYYAPPRSSYPQEAPSMPAPSHSRHPSSSSIGYSTPIGRNMPPPSSPQQQQQSQHTFPPPLPRGPPPSLGAPISSLTAGRDLPTLPPLNRPGSSMSISSMLGNTGPSTRDSGYQPPPIPGPLPFSNAAHPSTTFPASRSLISVAEPSSFGKRIRTPEPTRSQELHGPRDNRANSAGSPPRGSRMLTSPDVSRYGTSQSYSQRPAQGPQSAQGEERRDQYPMRVPNTSLPPRPNSQPTGFSVPPPPRPVDIGRSEMPPYGRPVYGDREPAYAYAERERQEKEAAMQRDREREHREREHRDRERGHREREFKRERERELHPDRERQDAEIAMQREAMQREIDRRELDDRSRVYATERSRQELLEREQARAQDRALSRELEQRERDRERENERREREFLERENERVRERDREREMVERERANVLQGIPPPYAHQQQLQHMYSNRPYEPREQQHLPWARPGYEQPLPDSMPQSQVHPSYEPPRNTPSAYPTAASAHAPHQQNDARYPPASQPQSAISHHGPSSAPQSYESSLHDRQRREMAQSQQPFSYGGGGGGAHTGPSLYQPHESPKRKQEDELKMIQQQQQRERERTAYLGVGQHEINRRGRLSPLPQAVQGAQGQSNGPGVESAIKSEFGRMFSGIGSGAIGMAATTPTTSGSHTPFSNPRLSHREDFDSASAGHEINGETAHKVNNPSRGVRRRKLKEEDSRDEDGSSTGRRTPSIRGSSKRPKISHPPGGSSNNPHTNPLTHRRVDTDNTSSPQANGTPYKITSGVNSPTSEMKAQSGVAIPHHHHVVRTPHHHHHHSAPQSHKAQTSLPLTGPTIPKPKQVIKSTSVTESVAHYPRHHLGSIVYTSELKPQNPSVKSSTRAHTTRRGYSSTPTPLPRFDGRENCTFTVQVPYVYLTKESREEITARRPVWGTDVYTDDSDVIAACIHAGWIRGEWPEDVDISMLGLEIDSPDGAAREGAPTTSNGKNTKGKGMFFDKPPPKGPMITPPNKDLHVTILILPTLEKYSSVTRFGIKSREWADNHDGLSFMILSIRWIDAGDGGRGRIGRKMRMIIAEEERKGEDERERALFERSGNHNATDADEKIDAQESFVRGDGAAPLVGSRFKGLAGSWWSKAKEKKKKVEHTELEAEVQDDRQDKGQKKNEVSAVDVGMLAVKEPSPARAAAEAEIALRSESRMVGSA